VTAPRRIPPGRAGRLWLLDRLRSGRLAASLLDRKVKILRAEQERLRTHAEQSRARWLDRAREADLWGQRAALLGGQREFLRGTPAEGADVDVEWGSIMGARYPVAATVRPGGFRASFGRRLDGRVRSCSFGRGLGNRRSLRLRVGQFAEVGEGFLVGHYAPTLFLRFIDATSRTWGSWPPCGCSVPL